MAFTIRPVDYYYLNVRDELGAAYRVLSTLAERGVNLLAFTAVPSGPSLAQFAIFPEDPNLLMAEARAAQLPLEGPHHALLVQGDDVLGAFATRARAPVPGGRGHLCVRRRDGLAQRLRLHRVRPRGPVRAGSRGARGLGAPTIAGRTSNTGTSQTRYSTTSSPAVPAICSRIVCRAVRDLDSTSRDSQNVITRDGLRLLVREHDETQVAVVVAEPALDPLGRDARDLRDARSRCP